ncbi:MAG TPA: tRNA (adenosine(37)-N6)-dimethylallyltransferase MiaA [Thermotogota bacterium]|nr:tRNA (adenosine(37)-N6)-dimethylallyltransferase MiaA [Thermotogota bacterium]HPR95177.1 tRNA (adenosine(37)-N6)-dimethylallyltransferase MiaA [Thermotogota bacterium]
MNEPKIPVLYAPTASGKTAIVMSLYDKLNIEICSMDSMQIYKKMNIGTAKPLPEELAHYPHHLIDIVYPDESYDVNQYRQDALNKIETVKARNRVPLFVGGTGLYMDILRYGLFEGVTRDEKLRRELEVKESETPGILMDTLSRIDPVAAAKIHPNDLKRKIRALEVYYKTGRKFSEMGRERLPDERFVLIYLSRERSVIYDRINRRVDQMIEMGLIEETSELMKGYTSDLQSMKAIGYRETIDYLNGVYDSKADYIDSLKKNTRHYAKRQIIWGRRYEEMERFDLDSEDLDSFCERLNRLIYI